MIIYLRLQLTLINKRISRSLNNIKMKIHKVIYIKIHIVTNIKTKIKSHIKIRIKIKSISVQEIIRPMYQIPKTHPLTFKLSSPGTKIKLEWLPVRDLHINQILAKLHKVIYQMAYKYKWLMRSLISLTHNLGFNHKLRKSRKKLLKLKKEKKILMSLIIICFLHRIP